MKIEPKNLELISAKHCEDNPDKNSSIVLRIVENGRLSTEGTLNFPAELGIKNVYLVDLLERIEDSDSIKIMRENDVIRKIICHWNPHEIITFRIEK